MWHWPMASVASTLTLFLLVFPFLIKELIDWFVYISAAETFVKSPNIIELLAILQLKSVLTAAVRSS